MQTTTRLREISLQEQIDLIISPQIYDKVRYLCQQIAKVEWSGVLFYKLSGSIADIENFKLEVADILLMDKGTAGYTEYKFDSDVMEHMMDNPELMECRLGHIHSHNTMDVFFSGVDVSELHDNVGNHNFYLSLIVNNFMEMTAKLCFTSVKPAVEVQNVYPCLDENEQPYDITLINVIPEEKVMFIYDCHILKPCNEITVEDKFKLRTEEIIERDKKKKEAKVYTQPNQLTGKAKGGSENKLLGNGKPKFDDANWEDWENGDINIGMGQIYKPEPGRVDMEKLFDEVAIDELFACYVLRKGEKVKEDDLETCLEEVTMEEQPTEAFSDHIIDNFLNYYIKFHEVPEPNMNEFLDALEVFNEELTPYKAKFSFVSPIITKISEWGDKLEEQSNALIKK